jgi:hypothetical protein
MLHHSSNKAAKIFWLFLWVSCFAVIQIRVAYAGWPTTDDSTAKDKIAPLLRRGPVTADSFKQGIKSNTGANTNAFRGENNGARSQDAPQNAQTFKVFLPLIVGTGTVTPPVVRKKGIGLTYHQCADVTSMNAGWQYDWGDHPQSCRSDNVPMFWNNIGNLTTSYSSWIMGFNEPDLASQANLTPDQAAALWRQVEQKYPSAKMLAPVPSQQNPNWIVDFRNAYIARYGTAPRLDALAMHCYAWDANYCISYGQWFKNLATSWNIAKVWVTEFAFLTCNYQSVQQAGAEMVRFIDWMELDPMIARYAWFAARIQGTEDWSFPPECNTALVDFNSGQPTYYGQLYASK